MLGELDNIASTWAMNTSNMQGCWRKWREIIAESIFAENKTWLQLWPIIRIVCLLCLDFQVYKTTMVTPRDQEARAKYCLLLRPTTQACRESGNSTEDLPTIPRHPDVKINSYQNNTRAKKASRLELNSVSGLLCRGEGHPMWQRWPHSNDLKPDLVVLILDETHTVCSPLRCQELSLLGWSGILDKMWIGVGGCAEMRLG